MPAEAKHEEPADLSECQQPGRQMYDECAQVAAGVRSRCSRCEGQHCQHGDNVSLVLPGLVGNLCFHFDFHTMSNTNLATTASRNCCIGSACPKTRGDVRMRIEPLKTGSTSDVDMPRLENSENGCLLAKRTATGKIMFTDISLQAGGRAMNGTYRYVGKALFVGRYRRFAL